MAETRPRYRGSFLLWAISMFLWFPIFGLAVGILILYLAFALALGALVLVGLGVVLVFQVLIGRRRERVMRGGCREPEKTLVRGHPFASLGTDCAGFGTDCLIPVRLYPATKAQDVRFR